MTTQTQLIQELETLVDRDGMYEVIAALGLVCFEKAEHIAASYDDKTLAKQWERDGNKIMKLAEKF